MIASGLLGIKPKRNARKRKPVGRYKGLDHAKTSFKIIEGMT